MYWILNTSTDPAFNLALEEHFLNSIVADHPGYAILWQNIPTIVVGRYQNTRQEVHADFVRDRNINVIRRMTGGGAVYHDAGTLNYTFIHHLSESSSFPSFSEAGKPVAEALQKLGLPVAFSGRNDLLLDGLKVAGVAHCRQGMRTLHHGCILVETDLDILSQALNVDPTKYISKGIASVRSRVGNLANYLQERSPSSKRICVADVRDAIMAHQAGNVYTLSLADVEAITRLREDKYSTWDWTYGASPPFTEHKMQRFSWGKLDVSFNIKQGHVTNCHIQGDFFVGASSESSATQGDASFHGIPSQVLASYEVHDLEKALCGVLYAKKEFSEVLDAFPLQSLFSGCNPAAVKAFLLPE